MTIAGRMKTIGIVALSVTIAIYGGPIGDAWARGGGGGHGGGGHGGGHEGEHHAEHREGEHHEEHHEGEHHGEHFADHHHDDHHWNHHHDDWHEGGWGWGPGFWGGAAVGYGLGAWSGWGYDGGNTYIDNSGSNNTTDEAIPQTENGAYNNTAAGSSGESNSENTAQQSGQQPNKLPVNVWPELGISTFSGHNGDQHGLVVVRVQPGGVGARAGLMAGDVILNINGQPTPDDEALETLLESAKGSIELDVVDANSGAPRTLSANLSTAASGSREQHN